MYASRLLYSGTRKNLCTRDLHMALLNLLQGDVGVHAHVSADFPFCPKGHRMESHLPWPRASRIPITCTVLPEALFDRPKLLSCLEHIR
jgi:hypothetical protein